MVAALIGLAGCSSGKSEEAGGTAACGNGRIEGGEACDDGNVADDGNGCAADCTSYAVCGDGVVHDALEQCDDGNATADGNGCSAGCRRAGACGDGEVQPLFEDCDDGDTVFDPANGCNASCQRAGFCGDGLLQSLFEDCDDGNLVDDDGCSNACRQPPCGDGVVQDGEACDPGVAGGFTASCNSDCTPSVCGDGTVNFAAGEQCDPGTVGGVTASCDPDCTPRFCGDGVVNTAAAETCDTAGVSAACDADCTAAACGDGVLNVPAGEACDDGNLVDTDGCRADCTRPRCGDGVVQAGEECEDGNTNNDDDCVACRVSRCGDGVTDLQAPGIEECDDGNAVDTDNCTSACKLAVCGDGILDGASPGVESCDDGNTSSLDDCTAACVPNTCGDGLRDLVAPRVEPCDDGNLSNEDDCVTVGGNCAIASCGDGFVDLLGPDAEECDPAAPGSSPATCDADCTLPSCGDGFLNPAAGELCDNGANNGTPGNACSATCKKSNGESCQSRAECNSAWCTGGVCRNPTLCGATGLVISQVFGGGGEYHYRNDFVELRNAGTQPVATLGMALQFPPAIGTGAWTVQALPDARVPPGGYLLVQEAPGGNLGAPALPAPDLVPTRWEVVDIDASTGTLALTSNTVALTGSTITRAVVDLVGFGPGAGVFETAPGPAPDAWNSLARLNGGCADTDHNGLDLVVVGWPTPRNSRTPSLPCACTANETGSALEMDSCILRFPESTTAEANSPTEYIYARVFEDAFTQPAGASAEISCQIGYGSGAVNPSTDADQWVWTSAAFNAQIGSEDEYRATLTVATADDYAYAARFSRDGRNWTYCDLDSAGPYGGITFDPSRLGSLTVTPDPRAPVVTISTPPAQGAVTNQTSASFTLTTNEPATICWKLDGGAQTCSAPAATTFAANLTNLPEGSHLLQVTATDAALNAGSASRGWTVDLTQPSVTIGIPPAEGARSNDTTPSIRITTNEPATICWTLDGAGAQTCGGPTTDYGAVLLNLSEGSHVLQVTATDVAQNAASASRTWTVDVTQPAITIPAPAANDPSPDIAITTNEPATICWWLDGAGPTCSASLVTTFTASLSNLANGRQHGLDVRAEDAAGNTSIAWRWWEVAY